MKKLSILGSALLLVFMGISSSGCFDDEEDEAGVDCAETFCIGTLLAEGEDFNAPLIEAVGLAKDDINKAGGNIEIISGNSFQAGAGEAVASAMELLKMGVRGILGPSYSSDSVAVHPFLNENQIVAVSPSATSPTLTDRNKSVVDAGGQPFFFRVSPSDLFQGPILAKQARGNTVIVNRDDAWGEALAAIVEKEIMSDGRQVEVVSYNSEPSPPAADVVSRVEAAVQQIPDVESIVLLVFSEGAEIIRGLLDSSVIPEGTGYYVGDGLVFSSNLFPHVDEENGEIEGFKQVISTPPPGTRLEEFKERFNFSDYTAHAYDAVVILRLAALSAGSNDPSVYVSKVQEVTRGGTKCHSYATCAAALTDETTINDDIDYEGLSGPIDLNENGDITDGLYAVDTYDAQGVAQRIYLDFQGEEANTN
ncbi:MAG: ABC transporter substrate-binding protein [Candidatus Dadabacteria bacterium]|nr:ABC transporter substrate-binding protein [Candidatus Dadabacteria bacterium]MDE0663345.1 ABC transporter substrate-binding protein [Candidatus Dadabacteria bacterium]